MPQARHVVDVCKRVVDAAVGGFVLELQRRRVVFPDLIADVEATIFCADSMSVVFKPVVGEGALLDCFVSDLRECCINIDGNIGV